MAASIAGKGLKKTDWEIQLTLSQRELSWQVQLSGIRQSKILKGRIGAGIAGKGLTYNIQITVLPTILDKIVEKIQCYSNFPKTLHVEPPFPFQFWIDSLADRQAHTVYTTLYRGEGVSFGNNCSCNPEIFYLL